jgi:glycosyltransferase involved in cell wall biosynthesis
MTNVSVIIPTYKDWSRLKLCLEALSKQTYPKDQFEVIVVNNDPGDECPFVLPAANIKIIEEAKPGSYAARNAGIKIAKGEILAFTDSDCIPDKGWIENGVYALVPLLTRKSLLSGYINLFFSTPAKLTLAECYEKYFAFPHQRNEKRYLRSMVTANAFIPAHTFAKLGFFNEGLMSGGDHEFGNRALQNNYKILFGKRVVVKHPARSSISDLLKKRRRVFGGKVYQSVFNGKNRILALFSHLVKSTMDYLGNLGHFFKPNNKAPAFDIIRCFIVVVLIIVVVFSEFFYLLFPNSAKRL